MWIEFTRKFEDGRPQVESLKPPGLDEPVEFNENGKANVSNDVGRYMVDYYPDVEASSSFDDPDEELDDDVEVDEPEDEPEEED